MPSNPDALYAQFKLSFFVHPQANGFVNDCAIALGSTEGVPQEVGGIQDVVHEPKLPKVEIACQMKSEEIILQLFGDELEKVDLALRCKPNVSFFDLLPP
jgi:hypothetical protein